MNKWDTINKPNQLSDPGYDFRREGNQALLNHILKTPLKKLDAHNFLCLFNGGILPAGNVVEMLYYFRQACTFVLENSNKSVQIHTDLSGWVSVNHKKLLEMGFLTLCIEELKPIWGKMINTFSKVIPYDCNDYYDVEDFVAMVSLLINIGQISFLNSFLHEKIEEMNAESTLICSLRIRYYTEYINALGGHLDYFFDHPTDILYVFEEFPRFDFYLNKLRVPLFAASLFTQENKALKDLNIMMHACSRTTQPLKICLLKEIGAIPRFKERPPHSNSDIDKFFGSAPIC